MTWLQWLKMWLVRDRDTRTTAEYLDDWMSRPVLYAPRGWDADGGDGRAG